MSNPFAKFAAGASFSKSDVGKSVAGGWMTTKKRGRDDAQIKKDSMKALASRRQSRGSGGGRNKKSTAGATKKQKTNPKRNKRRSDDWSEDDGDDDEYLDDFVVDDDEISFEEESSSSEEEEDDDEVVEVTKNRRQRARTTKTRTAKTAGRAKSSALAISSGSEEDEEEEEEDYDFKPTTKKAATGLTATRKKQETVDLMSSDESDEEGIVSFFDKNTTRRTSKPPPKSIAKKKRGIFSSDDESSQEEKKCEDIADRQFSDKSNRAPTSSKFFSNNKENRENSKVTSNFAATSKKRSSITSLSSSDDDDDDFNFSKNRNTQSTTNSRNNDDDDQFLSDADEDEQMALAMALSASQNDAEQPKKKKLQQNKKKKKKNAKRQVTVELSSDEEEEHELQNSKSPIIWKEDVEIEDEADDDEEVEVYVDEDELEAKSVLKTANDLSANVLRTMISWSEQGEEDAGGQDTGTLTDKRKDTKAVQGMIVDGAMAMFQCTNKGNEASSQSWISQEEMQKICPKLKLAPYQIIGVNWLALLHSMTYDVERGDKKQARSKNKSSNSTNVNGVLADEMGLGKTVQTIAFLGWLRHYNNKLSTTNRSKDIPARRNEVDSDEDCDDGENNVINLEDDDETAEPYRRPHIIIVPASVLSNWEREFEKFCPTLKVVKYHGSMAERYELQEKLRKSLPGKQGRRIPLDVILTTFSYFSSEKSDDRSFLRKFNFDYMVIDEAHCLKNPRGARYKNLNKFSTSHRLLLTGTPVQNSPKELMSLLCFLMPLFSRSASKGGGFDDDNNDDVGDKMLQHFVNLESSQKSNGGDSTAYKKLKQLFAPFVLRRRKQDVLSQLIPPKTRKVEFVSFNESSRMVYDSIMAAHIKNRNKKSEVSNATAQQHLFTALRKAANHQLLLRTRHKSEEEIEHLSKQLLHCGYFGRDESCTLQLVQKELENFSDFDIHFAALDLIDENPCRAEALDRYTLTEDDMLCSPKFLRLRALLPDLIADGHRILIFSQWTRVMDLLGCLMQSLKLEYLRLDGQTAISERQNLIDKFNRDSEISVFLLSTRAGGMGINLTAADTCILHDLDFNPFNDAQAEDRCHRIGQTKPVTVYKLVTEGTVDASIYEMQQRKAKMNAAIMESGSASTDSDTTVYNKKSSKKKDDEEINKMLQAEEERFLQSPRQKYRAP